MDKAYLEIGTAQDLDVWHQRLFYRLLEIFPGFLSWTTLIGVVLLSWLAPVFVAYFIIVFDIYWLLKTVFLSFHLRSTYSRMQKHLKINWLEKIEKEVGADKYREFYHLIILPMVKESHEVVSETFQSLVNLNYPKDKMIVTLALEERAGDEPQETARKIREKFDSSFFKLFITTHPKNVEGELAGKGSNQTWAAKEVKKEIDKLGIPYEKIIVSVFDVDTVLFPEYFGCLTYHFLTCADPYHSSFQPIPIFNNNIWQAPALSRVVATSGTFWHMMQQERPERLATFSSHSMSFKAITELNYWNIKNVSEDSRIYWKALMYYDGNYHTVPLFYPVSMDANLAPTFIQTMFNVYKQQRRWGWGVENIPYIFYGFYKNKKMSFFKKLKRGFEYLEGFWSWATNSLLIFLLGWLPLALGGDKFNSTPLSYNLPQITRTLMTLAMIGLISSAIYSLKLLPPRPKNFGGWRYLTIVLQWALLPFSIIIFGSFPGLEAQTRLMFGKYMGFWVTPKARKMKGLK